MTNVAQAGEPVGGLSPAGLFDVAYAYVDIQGVNDPPTIDSVTPLDFDHVIAPGSSLVFGATASDPESDPVSYSWKMDDTEVSTNSGWTYNPAPGEGRLKIIVLTVSDDSPFSRDSFETWRVLVNTPLRLSFSPQSAGRRCIPSTRRRRTSADGLQHTATRMTLS